MTYNRNREDVGMIENDSFCVQLFKKHGWEWGGDWSGIKDYQHFEKSIFNKYIFIDLLIMLATVSCLQI